MRARQWTTVDRLAIVSSPLRSPVYNPGAVFLGRQLISVRSLGSNVGMAAAVV
jgi:hypothetical protein